MMRGAESRSPLGRLAGGLAALFFLIVAVASIGDVVLVSQGAAGACSASQAPSPGPGGGTLHGVPRRLIPLYVGASRRYRLGARGPGILAAINFVETGFGTNMATSSAGANGWMAFLPSTWAVWGVDANRDGRKDPYDPVDAIYSAARYLHASGAPGDWYQAVFAYNHADWYVQKVFSYARRFSGIAQLETPAAPAGGADCRAEPSSPTAMSIRSAKTPIGSRSGPTWGSTTRRFVPSVPVLAIGEAKVLGSDSASAWPGGHFIWYRLLGGDHKGDIIFVAETLSDLAPAGKTVRAGDRIAVAHTGGTGIETGFALASGSTRAAPCYSEGLETNSGKEMARFMKVLGAKVQMDPGPGPDYPTGPLC